MSNPTPVALQEYAVTQHDQCLVWADVSTDDGADRFVTTDFGSMFYVWEWNYKKGMYYVVHKEFVATLPALDIFDAQPYREAVRKYSKSMLERVAPVFTEYTTTN